MLGYDSRTSFTISNSNSANSFDGYLAEFYYIDGTALDATSFGETSNGIWVPKQYSGSYGTNGFYLSFADSGNIGDDLSGNGNDWTANNLAASDVVPDSPTNNFAVLNAIVNVPSRTLSEGNLKVTFPNSSGKTSFANFSMKTGKFYWEGYLNTGTRPVPGLTDTRNISAYQQAGATDAFVGASTVLNPVGDAIGVRWDNALMKNGSIITSSFFGSAVAVGQTFGIAFDADTGEVWFSQNGTWVNTGGTSSTTLDPSNPDITVATGTEYTPAIGHENCSWIYNFGQDSTFAGATTAGGNSDANGYGDFAYSPPSGFLALCTANLPEPSIGPNSDTTSDEHFNTVLYSGTGSPQSITGVGFQPDFVWIKGRSNARRHMLFDVVRGVQNRLISDDTNTELTMTDGLSSFDVDGFTEGGNLNTGNSGDTLVAWNWKAGGTAVSNTEGSITSSVSANQDAGFSIVSYTGTGANATVGHGLLASAPEMIIVKSRTNAYNWTVYHSGTASDPETDYLVLDVNNAVSDFNTVWNDTAPTNSVFSLGSFIRSNNASADLIAYCFHSVEGFSKVGSYEGNSSGTEGPFVFTGFAPSFVMGKAIDQTGRWWMYDSARSPQMNYSIGTGAYLAADLTSVEAADSGVNAIQLLSNGFKVNTTNGEWNGSGLTYIYLAFAEAPFKYANAR
jgi:hypothetical protein